MICAVMYWYNSNGQPWSQTSEIEQKQFLMDGFKSIRFKTNTMKCTVQYSLHELNEILNLPKKQYIFEIKIFMQNKWKYHENIGNKHVPQTRYF